MTAGGTFRGRTAGGGADAEGTLRAAVYALGRAGREVEVGSVTVAARPRIPKPSLCPVCRELELCLLKWLSFDGRELPA